VNSNPPWDSPASLIKNVPSVCKESRIGFSGG